MIINSFEENLLNAGTEPKITYRYYNYVGDSENGDHRGNGRSDFTQGTVYHAVILKQYNGAYPLESGNGKGDGW